MDDSHLQTLTDIKKFLNTYRNLKSSGLSNLKLDTLNTLGLANLSNSDTNIAGKLSTTDKTELYNFIVSTLVRFHYFYLNISKKDKTLIRQYLMFVTGYSKSQLTRLIGRYNKEGKLYVRDYKRNNVYRKYSDTDISLLAKTDKLHNFINGVALKHILVTEYKVYKKVEFKNISQISISRIYDFRQNSSVYKKHNVRYTKTKPVVSSIGRREKPSNDSKPGLLRVDSVHGGDMVNIKGRVIKKGVYYINLVDDFCQFEVVIAVQGISNNFLIPALEKAIQQFPFKITKIHTDNGSEYINKLVANLLNKLHIDLTKSRPRHSSDNGLVESKNGSIIRKWLGYGYIESTNANKINESLVYLNKYVNYYRPSAFPQEKLHKTKKNKIIKSYPHEMYMTPYNKLKSIKNYKTYLKETTNIKKIEKEIQKVSPNQMAKILQEKLTDKLNKLLYDKMK